MQSMHDAMPYNLLELIYAINNVTYLLVRHVNRNYIIVSLKSYFANLLKQFFCFLYSLIYVNNHSPILSVTEGVLATSY